MARKHFNTSTPAAIALAAGFFVSLGTLTAGTASAEPNPLAGPDVDADKGDSLIERNIDGSMRRPEAPIAEAALKTVDLDAPTKAKIDALLASRAKQIDGIVKANLETLNTMKTDRQANAGSDNPRASRREHARKIMEMFKPVLEKGPLEDQIAALMPEASRVAYITNIEEHRELMIAERRARGPENGRRGGRPGLGRPGSGPRGGEPGMDDGPMLFEDPMLEMLDDEPRRGPEGERRRRGRPERGRPGGEFGGPGGEMRDMAIQLGTLQMEIRRSIERLSDDRTARTDDFIARLDLDPEQEGKVRELLQKARQSSRESDDPRAARREVMRELAEILTPEQRQTLRESMGRGARRGPGAAGNRRPGRGNADGDD